MTDHELDVLTERIAHGVLRVAGELPGQMGRLRAARIVGGFPVQAAEEELREQLAPYRVEGAEGRPLRELVAMVDALLDGGLLAQTTGQRPTIVLTRAGHRALDALEVQHRV